MEPEFDTELEFFSRLEYVETADGPHWGVPIYMHAIENGKKVLKKSYIFRSVECPLKTIEHTDGLTGQKTMLSKHQNAKPVLASVGCTDYEADPINPDRIYLMPKGFYLTRKHYALMEARHFDPEQELRVVCAHCVKEHVDKLILKDPSLFVDLRKQK